MTGEKEVLKTTCPRDCYDACGIVAIKRDGAITRVLGDPDHPVSRVWTPPWMQAVFSAWSGLCGQAQSCVRFPLCGT